MKLKQFFDWLVLLWNWLAEAKIVFMALFILIMSILLGFFTWNTEQSIRIAGAVLQLVGMSLAISGVIKVRKYFKQPSLKALVVYWVRRFPIFKKNRYTISGRGAFSIDKITGKVEEQWLPDTNVGSAKQQIEIIQKNMEILRKRQDSYEAIIDNISSDFKSLDKKVDSKVTAMKEDIQSEIESIHIDDSISAIIGLLLITIGIFFSSFAPELEYFSRVYFN